MKVDFWQLSHDPAEKVVALIAQRVIDEGERLLVVSDDPDQRAAISKALWRAGATSFLAHGEALEPQSGKQPILLSDQPEGDNRANHIIYADGRWRQGNGFARSFLLFDEATLEAARATWRWLDGTQGLERAFYRQDNGKWVKVA